MHPRFNAMGKYYQNEVHKEARALLLGPKLVPWKHQMRGGPGALSSTGEFSVNTGKPRLLTRQRSHHSQYDALTAKATCRRQSLNIAQTVICIFILATFNYIEMSGRAHSWIMTYVRGARNRSKRNTAYYNAKYVSTLCMHTAMLLIRRAQMVGSTRRNPERRIYLMISMELIHQLFQSLRLPLLRQPFTPQLKPQNLHKSF